VLQALLGVDYLRAESLISSVVDRGGIDGGVVLRLVWVQSMVVGGKSYGVQIEAGR